MYSILKTENFQRGCILYEFLSMKPIFDCYKSFCKNIGPAAMDYQKFEMWFYKFNGGSFNLEDDENFDRKTKNIGDLPITIVERIVNNYLNELDRFMVKQVSRALADIVKPQPAGEIYVNFIVDDDEYTVTSGYEKIEFKKIGNYGTLVKYNGDRVEIERSNPIEYASKWLKDVLKAQGKAAAAGPFLNISWRSEESTAEFEEWFTTESNEKFEILSLTLEGLPYTTIHRIILNSNPGLIAHINISNVRSSERESDDEAIIKEIVESEQWKAVLQLYCDDGRFKFTDFLHAERFTMSLQKSVTEEEVIHIAQMLSKCPKFDECSIELTEDFDPNPLEIALAPFCKDEEDGYLFEFGDDSCHSIGLCIESEDNWMQFVSRPK